MKTYFWKSILVFAGILLLSIQSFSQIPTEIVESIQKGDDLVLSGYFNQNVELVVLNHDDVYSKPHARQIVAAFFKENKPQEFSIIHQGGKDGAKYAIGSLIASTGVFRVYFLLKIAHNNSYIHQLRIEKQG